MLRLTVKVIALTVKVLAYECMSIGIRLVAEAVACVPASLVRILTLLIKPRNKKGKEIALLEGEGIY